MVVTEGLAGRRQQYAMAVELNPYELSQIVGGRPTESAVVLDQGLLQWGSDQDGVKFLTVSSEQGSRKFGQKTVVVYDGIETQLIEEIYVRGGPKITHDGQVIAWEKQKAYRIATITDTEILFSEEDANYVLGGVSAAWSEVQKKI